MAGQVAYSLLVNEDVEASLLLKGGQGRTHLQEPPQQGLHAHPVPLTVHPGQHHQPYNSGQNSIELYEQAGLYSSQANRRHVFNSHFYKIPFT